MNRLAARQIVRGSAVAALVFSTLLIAACASTPTSPPGSAEVRSKLSALQNDPNLADRAKIELRDAEEAVRLAEQPLPSGEAALGKHRVYMADRKVEIARAKATTRYAEAQRAQFADERADARLAARTQEADRARLDADRARADADRAQADASRARAAADDARSAEARASADAALRAAELQRQIDVLEAKATERGLVLTLGDVLFATGSAELQSGARDRLDKLVNFLNEYPERRVLIEGHTDNVGGAVYNETLSHRRAKSVSDYLTERGIAWQRLSASGMGMDRPIASNDTAGGRQQNRRVEIIIENEPLVSSGETD